MSAISAPWIASAGCPAHIRPALERWVNSHNALWLQSPSTGEVFESFEHCLHRLQLFAVSQGFAVIIRGSGNDKKTPSRRYVCIHHDNETRNWRELEETVEKDPEDKIVSIRKRNMTYTKQKGSKWYAYCSYKDVGKRCSGVKGYSLSVRVSEHTHRLVENPLMYEINQLLIPEYQ